MVERQEVEVEQTELSVPLDASIEALAPLFKALAHPKRLAILEILRGREMCVCEIEQTLSLRQAYVSQQLMVLREAGLVCYRRRGWNIYYRISRPEVYALLDLAKTIHGKLGTCAVTPEELVHDPDSCCGYQVSSWEK